MMKLKFIKPHKSIVKLNDIEINEFAIVTGLNGTGKTHLLHAIEEGAIVIEGIQSSEIVYYNYSDFNIDYDLTPKTAERKDQTPPVKKNASKNGSSIVQRIISERNQIINSSDFLLNTEFDNLIENVLSNGHLLSILDWNEDEIKSYKDFKQISSESGNYWDVLHTLPEKIRVVHDTYSQFTNIIEISAGSFNTNIINYFNKLIIRNMGFNPNFLSWTKFDEEKYKELQSQNPSFQIWEYDGVFSPNFFNFISIYQDLKNQFPEYPDQDLSTLKKELTNIFNKLEICLRDRLSPEYLRFIKNFSIDNNIFSHLQIDSGALDLNLIANEEKQYQINKNQNDYNGFLKKEKAVNVSYYTDEKFVEIYGSSPVVIGKSEYTTFGNLECSKNGNNGAAFLAIRNAA